MLLKSISGLINMTKSKEKFIYFDILDSTQEVEFAGKPFSAYGSIDIGYLKSKALAAPRKRYRICLHNNHSSGTQEMLICLAGFSYFHPHRHPGNRSESYHMIEGRLDVYLLDEFGALLEKIELAAFDKNEKSQKPFIYRVSGPIYHFTVPRSELTIYHEVLTGPWGSEAIEYAKFAPGDNEEMSIRLFVENLTGLTLEELIVKH